MWRVWKDCQEKGLCVYEKSMATLQHGKPLQMSHLNKAQDFRINVLWTDETNLEMFGHNALPYLAKTRVKI